MLRLRRVVLDIDKPIKEPSLFTLAEAIQEAEGVLAINITVHEMDIDTMGLNVTIEGDGFDFAYIEEVIEEAGAVIHGVDQIVAGEYLVESITTPVT